MVDRHFADDELAAIYDYFTPTEGRPDFAFYFPSIMVADSVLDAGCGSGGLLKRARDEGHGGRLVGLDPAHGMLRSARPRRDIEWVQQDIASASFQDEFDLVVMTGHTFQSFLDDVQVRHALKAVRTALGQDGRLVFETRMPPDRSREDWADDYAVDIEDEAGYAYRVECTFDTAADGDLVSFKHTFTAPEWPGPRISRSALRFMDPSTLQSFLAEAGFEIEHQFGDWDRSPVTESSPEIITIAAAA